MSHTPVAVITGSAQGIGAAIADELAACGHDVVLADLNLHAVRLRAAEIGERHGVRVAAHRVDAANPTSIASLAKAVLADFQRVDVLVNNAGIAEDAATLEASDGIWERVLRVNLLGTLNACREFGQALIEHRGAIVNIASIAAFVAGNPERHIGYDASKAGVVALTRTLGVEWANRGVRVNAVAPGYSATPILDGVGASDPSTMAAWLSQVPQGRLMQPQEIAKVVAFLASPSASAIAGQTIIADGGYLASK